MLGLIGEYIGRAFLTINQRPQAVVREMVTNVTTAQGQGHVRTVAGPVGAVDAASGQR